MTKKSKILFMETTEIDPAKTVGEIQEILSRYGASHVLTEYEDGEVSGVTFNIKVNGNNIPFKLPCRWKAIFNVFKKRAEEKDHWPDYFKKKESEWECQAKRVGWRQILRWIEAQMALVETGMVKVEEIFMPYLLIGRNETLFEKMEETQFKMLEHKT